MASAAPLATPPSNGIGGLLTYTGGGLPAAMTITFDPTSTTPLPAPAAATTSHVMNATEIAGMQRKLQAELSCESASAAQSLTHSKHVHLPHDRPGGFALDTDDHGTPPIPRSILCKYPS